MSKFDAHPPISLLYLWSDRLIGKASNQFSTTNTDQLASAITIAVNARLDADAAPIDKDTAIAWLEHRAAPATWKLHEVLMDALKLPQPNPALSAFDKSLLDVRTTMENLYIIMPESNKANPEPKPEAPTRAAKVRAHSKTNTRQPRAEIAGHWHDSPYAPKRLLPENNTYAALDKSERSAMRHATPNAHEFFALYRLIRAADKSAPSDPIDITAHSLHGFETGKTIPGLHSLSQLKPWMDQYNPDDYPRFEDRIISNRLDICAGLKKERDATPGGDAAAYHHAMAHFNTAIARNMEEMPQRYWRAVIDAYLDPHFADAPNQPSWHQRIAPIEVKEDYLQAMRHYLSLTTEKAAESFGVSTSSIRRVEASLASPDDEAGKAMLRFFKKQQKAMDADEKARDIPKAERSKPFFDARQYEALEMGYDAEIAAEHRADKWAARSANKPDKGPAR